MNLRKPEKVKVATSKKEAKSFDLESLVSELVADPKFLSRGLQGIHAEVMRRLVSLEASVFVDYADVRAMVEQVQQKKESRKQVVLFE
jgi:hypothetical protein